MIYSCTTHPELLIEQLNEGDVLEQNMVVSIKRNKVKWVLTYQNIKTKSITVSNPIGKYSKVWSK